MKIKIPWYMFLYCIVMICGGYGRVLFYSMILLFIHDFCHVLVAFALKQRVSYIKIYPVGLSMEIVSIEYSHSLIELLIAMAGPLSFYVSSGCLFLLCKANFISTNFFDYLMSMNISIFLFNCLPIYPLDGGRILHALCHYLFNYKWAHFLCLFLSLLVCCIFLFLFDFTMLYVYVGGLGMYSILRIVTIKNTIREFNFYRYVHPNNCKRIIKNKGKYLYRNYTSNMVRFQQSENEYLRSIFMHCNRK